MDAQIENHLPLITARLKFVPKVFPPPPIITPRMKFPAIDLEPRYNSPEPETRHPTALAWRETTPAQRETTPARRATTPIQRATTPPKRVRILEGPSRDVRRGSSPNYTASGEAIEVESLSSPSLSDEDEIMGDDEDDEASGIEEGIDNEGTHVGLIKKPVGDVSHPGRGGYNLSKALGWNQKTYDSVLVAVTKQAKERLDTTQSYRGQSKKKVHQLVETVRKEFGFLKDYEKDWPIHDMLKTHLKNSSQAHRNAKGRENTVIRRS